ncbi:hypothetical protein [Streptomyces sp. Ru73]|nr:hypothetical protein [Streptomyces sp. Ru73]
MGLIDQFRAKQRELDERARAAGEEKAPERPPEAASRPRSAAEEGMDA